jgi:glycerol-3-phosphate dehydrogenase
VAASLMAGVLGWDTARTEREVQTYLKRVAAERASQQQPDDESAERIRLEAPEIVDVDAAAATSSAVTRTATGPAPKKAPAPPTEE